MARNRIKNYTKRVHFILTDNNSSKIIELSKILKTSQNKIINKLIELTSSLHFIIQSKKENNEK